MSQDYNTLRMRNGAVLAVGRRPPTKTTLPFDVIVLMAQEYQPPRQSFPAGMKVIYAPIPDGPLTASQRRRVDEVGAYVASALLAGKRVLVTCWMGLNRSGMVAAIALVKLGDKPDAAVSRIRLMRGRQALFNPWFNRVIRDTRAA